MPFSWPRLLTGALVWNLLVLCDRYVLGYPIAQGPLTVLALGLLAAICLTLPRHRQPGRWFLEQGRRAPRASLLFLGLASLAALLAGALALELLGAW